MHLGRHFFVFNVADAAINIGVVLLIFDLLLDPARAERSKRRQSASGRDLRSAGSPRLGLARIRNVANVIE